MALFRFIEVKSQRGKSLLSYQNFEYQFENESRMEQGWEYWRCPVRPPYCPGRATIQSPWLIDEEGIRYKMGRVTKEHNHAATIGSKDVILYFIFFKINLLRYEKQIKDYERKQGATSPHQAEKLSGRSGAIFLSMCV